MPNIRRLKFAFVIPRFDFMIITVIAIINIELRYYMCVHSKMGVDNFVVLQNR